MKRPLQDWQKEEWRGESSCRFHSINSKAFVKRRTLLRKSGIPAPTLIPAPSTTSMCFDSVMYLSSYICVQLLTLLTAKHTIRSYCSCRIESLQYRLMDTGLSAFLAPALKKKKWIQRHSGSFCMFTYFFGVFRGGMIYVLKLKNVYDVLMRDFTQNKSPLAFSSEMKSRQLFFLLFFLESIMYWLFVWNNSIRWL